MEKQDIIQCACGQRMRLPANSQGKLFKCVKCGAFIQRDGEVMATPTGAAAQSAQQAPPQQTPAPQPPKEAEGATGPLGALAELLVEMNLLTREQAQYAATQQAGANEKFFETLIRLEIVAKERLHSVLSREPGIAAINLAHFNIDRHLTEVLPLEVVLKHWALPIDQLGRSITVAMVCPVDMETVAVIENLTGRRVRPMLCTMDDFLSAVHKHYRLPDEDHAGGSDGFGGVKPEKSDDKSSAMLAYGDKEQIKGNIAALDRLLIPARVMNQVDAVVGAEGEGLRQVIRVVGSSPPFAANILGTVNSSAYGLAGSVDNLPMAIALLGDQAVALLAAESPKIPAASEKLWSELSRFCRNSAEIAAAIALDSGVAVPNLAYCATLLHCIGSYALGTMDAEEYKKIEARLTTEKRLRAEEKVFGMGHDEIGGLLCREWNLPEALCASVTFYLKPDQAGSHQALASLVNIAVNLATIDEGIHQDGAEACSKAMEYLGLSRDAVLNAASSVLVESVTA